MSKWIKQQVAFSQMWCFCLYDQTFIDWFSFFSNEMFLSTWPNSYCLIHNFQINIFFSIWQILSASWLTLDTFYELNAYSRCIWMIHLDSMDDYMFFSNDISFEFYDHMLLFMISSLSFFDHIILAMVIPLSFSWSIYFFPMIFDLSKSLILDIL